MRLFFAALALAGALTAAPPAQADDRFLLAMMSADDIVRAVRCAPPRVCRLPARRRPPAAPVQGGAMLASYYAHAHHGRRTANGERFDMHALTAAHKSLPFGTRLRVSRAGLSVVVRINDRGPYIAGRSLDLSLAAAQAIGLVGAGVGSVQIELVRAGPSRQAPLGGTDIERIN